MLLSQTVEYALRAAVCLAGRDEGQTTPEIAETTKVPPSYLSKVLQGLARAGIVEGKRGVGGGFKLAMSNLDIFRSSVAAAALGFARRALDEGLAHARGRRMFGQALADFQLTQAGLAEMATRVDASMLLTYRAAWQRDVQRQRTTRAAAMAKLVATENAQRVIDRALQLPGGRGVQVGTVVESLYREIRALRIYEGATEVQQLIVGRDVLGGG
jgi:acyl-CoA dehydrogenase